MGVPRWGAAASRALWALAALAALSAAGHEAADDEAFLRAAEAELEEADALSRLAKGEAKEAEKVVRRADKAGRRRVPGRAGAEAASADDSAHPASGEDDPTQALLKQLTISMVSEVVDGRTVRIRDYSAKAGPKLLRLGNTAVPERGSQSEAEYEDKLESSRGALRQLLGKQMIWWKAAAEEVQPTGEGELGEASVLADVWLMDGRHVATMLVAEGHLAGAEQYTEELARDILTAGSDEAKKRAYRELEEAIKESQKHTAEETKAAKTKAEADLPPEGIGLGGWVGIFMLVGILTWAVFLAPAKKKKVNLNRKRGLFEKMWLKLKGA